MRIRELFQVFIRLIVRPDKSGCLSGDKPETISGHEEDSPRENETDAPQRNQPESVLENGPACSVSTLNTKSPFFKYSAVLCRVLAGGILAASGFLKLMSPPEELAYALEAYDLFPYFIVAPLSQFLPWVEILTGVYLLVGYGLSVFAFSTILMSLGFLSSLVLVKWRGIDLTECGCFGQAGPHLEPWQAMVLDGCLLVMGVIILFDRVHWLSLDHWLNHQETPRV